ncbi:MAG: ABC transporter ATP-binding protein [Bacteroidia bacterium]|jgi:ABC-type lipoprotein export system ATPase subunit|nr:ABC transporter ATP-binding protein [Bacteroidia bacterium]GIV24009.1 MAG: lipoprotein-releasing system ATP-binding protein LolD 2 [Bacteroidia bacterium]
MAEILLHATKLRKAYQGRCILEGIDLELEQGRFYALVGHSGSGKTTLLYLLALLEEPDEGEIFWQGTALRTRSATEKATWRNKNIGFVFQFFHLIAELRVWENVALPAVLAGKAFRSVRNQAYEWLERVGLHARANDWPTRLSGGEQQRVAIARALFQDPPLLLADEPTGNLDAEQARQVWELFLKLTREKSKTILVATHNLTLAQDADIRLRLTQGRLVREA